MSTIENYGFTKTLIRDNGRNIENEIKWIGDYDGNVANINVNINENGNNEFVSFKLSNNDIMNILGIQPFKVPLEKRLMNDYVYNPIILEGALTKRKSCRYNKKIHKGRKRKTYKRNFI
jgi:hypothetical protein